ncbi:MAG: AAC(3) family N-acetyltransferase [Dokdonella sp.]
MRSLKRTAKLFTRVASQGWVTADGITGNLRALGVRSGTTLLVHSSLSSLGFVVGGAEAVVRALLSAIGPDGTLVLPTHTWDRSGRGDFTFDVRHTPSCVGAITEAFRTMSGVTRSLHPTHSVAAIGPGAISLTEAHELSTTPCGEGTPYTKLIQEQAQILFLGTTLDQNTIYHSLESLAQMPYLMRHDDESFTTTDWIGTTRVARFRRHQRGPDRNFAATQGVLEAHAILRKGRVAASDSLLVECAPMAGLVLELLRKNPRYLLQ